MKNLEFGTRLTDRQIGQVWNLENSGGKNIICLNSYLPLPNNNLSNTFKPFS